MRRRLLVYCLVGGAIGLTYSVVIQASGILNPSGLPSQVLLGVVALVACVSLKRHAHHR